MISLEMKCPPLSKPEVTAARNQNSIGDRKEKKPWEKPGLVGDQLSSGQTNQQFVPTVAKSDYVKESSVSRGLVPMAV